MKLTEIQEKARDIISSAAIYIMLFGGSRSGKTFILVRAVVVRALKAPFSRHAILRFRFNHCKHSIILDTFPKVMQLCFPDIYNPDDLNKTDWYYQFPNGAQIWFGGLDDKERTEKILGQEHVTIYLNECSQILYSSVEIVKTRLAQLISQVVNGVESPMTPKLFCDCNPPSKAHWAYRMFIKKQDPEKKFALLNPELYASLQMNPEHNSENLAPQYLETLRSLSAAKRKRFLDGAFSDDNPNALFNDLDIEKWRVTDGSLPDFLRVVVGVDPSGAGEDDNADNDEVGCVVGALGVDGNAYILEDCTIKAGPSVWGRVAVTAYDRHEGDVIVGEVNFGGAMVGHVIKTCSTKAESRVVFKEVTASRGKVVRAEPFSVLYEQGRVRHVGYFPELEDELIDFSTMGYLGSGSPNRADALIWVLAELFPGMIKQKKKQQENLPTQAAKRSPHRWGSSGKRRQ